MTCFPMRDYSIQPRKELHVGVSRYVRAPCSMTQYINTKNIVYVLHTLITTMILSVLAYGVHIIHCNYYENTISFGI